MQFKKKVNVVTKLYLCDGCACNKLDICFLSGGECCYTANENFSASKTFAGSMPKTTWTKLDGYEKEVFSTQDALRTFIC